MKQWHLANLETTSTKLFKKVHQRKHLAHHNHELHFLARDIDTCLPAGLQSLRDGTYTPRCIKRRYFEDETVDQLYPTDRNFQHCLLQQIKSTFRYVMNPNCYHLAGPSGVKTATQRIKEVLDTEKPQYVIRADIHSFYSSILHHKLIQDVQKYYDDPKLLGMLAQIITNPIETPNGYQNPIRGIALRGPLSQFFSGIYLKPLDDAFLQMNVTYLRYQDDILILCQSQRQMNRCKRRLMEVLNERHLRMSRKKTRMGHIRHGFHFLGVQYSLTQPESDTTQRPQAVQLIKEMRGGWHL